MSLALKISDNTFTFDPLNRIDNQNQKKFRISKVSHKYEDGVLGVGCTCSNQWDAQGMFMYLQEYPHAGTITHYWVFQLSFFVLGDFTERNVFVSGKNYLHCFSSLVSIRS